MPILQRHAPQWTQPIGWQPGDRAKTALLIALVVAGGVLAGWGAARGDPVLVLVIALAAPLMLAGLRSLWLLFAVLIGALTMLPFFVLPVSAGGASPTLFEVLGLALVGGYAAVLLIDRRERLVARGPVVAWLLFGGYLVFVFVLGSRFGAGAELTRLFLRFGLALALFWLTVQLVRSRAEASRLAGWIVGGTALAAALGLVLYAGGVEFTHRMLLRLVPYGYPDTRVVRWIEDNPANPMRLTGTGIDPNAFGGMLMLGFVLAVGLAFSREKPLPVVLIWAAIALTGLGVLLTYSRGAWVGSAVGAGIIVWFRARWLVPLGLLGALAALVAGLGGGFVARFEAGLRLQDPATRMRLDEYENALRIIREHPWFGIGFGDAPSPEFGVGVSSIYFLIAEQAGLVGLAAFLILVGVIAMRGWRAFRRSDDDLILAVGAALAAALTVGLVDHYFINIRFVHLVALFWILAGLLFALSEMDLAPAGQKGEAG